MNNNQTQRVSQDLSRHTPVRKNRYSNQKQCQMEQAEELDKAIRQNLEVLGYGE